MTVWSLTIAAVVGAIVGSFLNVCIYRLPRGGSVVSPGSTCPHCGHVLSWFENVPVLSYIALLGRCRSCAKRISWQYPIVELVTVAVFTLCWWYYGPGWLLVSRLVFFCALIVLFAIDLEHHLLPNVITLPGIVIGFVLSFFTEPGWVASLIGLILGGIALWAVAEGYYLLRHEEGLGMGDVKMLSMIGAFVGWKLTVITLLLASLSGSVIGIGLIVTGRGTMKYALPFGTFLALGAAAAASIGPDLLSWYLGLW